MGARLGDARAAHDPPETTGLDSCVEAAEDDSWEDEDGEEDSAEDDEDSGDAADPCADPDSPEALDPEPVEPDSAEPELDPAEPVPDSAELDPDSAEPELDPAEPDPDSPVPEAAVPDPDSPVPLDPDAPAALDWGAWAGAWREPVEPVEVPVDEPAAVPAESLEPRCDVAETWAPDADALTVLPGKALAATAVSTPARAVLPAISQRLARASLRIAASRVRVVWGGVSWGGVSIESGVEFIGSVFPRSTSSG